MVGVSASNSPAVSPQMVKRRARKFYSPDRHDFREIRLLSRLSQSQCAELLHVQVRTLQNWERGRTRVPYSAFKLLKVLARFELPHELWDGWSVTGDVLWSPDGRSFRPWELYALRFVFAMARCWREQYGAKGTPALPNLERRAPPPERRQVAQASAPGDPGAAGEQRLAWRCTGGSASGVLPLGRLVAAGRGSTGPAGRRSRATGIRPRTVTLRRSVSI